MKFIDDNRRVCGLRLRIKKAVYVIYKTACTMLPCRTYLNVEVLEIFFEIAILMTYELAGHKNQIIRNQKDFGFKKHACKK